MKPEPKLERWIEDFRIPCHHCEMMFETVESMERHEGYWHVKQKKEEDNGQ